LAGRKRNNGVTAAATLIAVLVCLWLLIHEITVLLLLLVASGGAFILFQLVLPHLRRRAIVDKAVGIVRQHEDHLARRKKVLVRQDAYGKPLLERWHSEREYFITEHIRPAFRIREQRRFDRERARIVPLITAAIENAVRNRPALEKFSDAISPAEFEVFCAEELRRAGWDARVTQHSRDQGVDVIAEKSNTRVVLQCKLYSNPVGNKAVQEISAGRIHESAHYGIVVTNSTYTAPAEELATTNGILLLHYSDLGKLEALLLRSQRSLIAGA
jgi:hypothetical protein